MWADTGNVAVFINLMDSPLTLCPRTLRAAPCPAPGGFRESALPAAGRGPERPWGSDELAGNRPAPHAGRAGGGRSPHPH